jgi:tetratricopeptide (TPR) repeat protein
MTIRELTFWAALTFLLSLSGAARATGTQPWDAPFHPDAAAILKSATQITVASDQPVDVLLDEYRFEFSANAKLKSTYRKVYRLVRQDAVDGWSSVDRQYQPWRDSKPSVRARVITIDGAVHVLDPKTIADSPAADADDSVFSDARVIRFPLPAVAAGAIVEYEISLESSPSFSEAGLSGRVSVFDGVPLERLHVTLDAPKGVPAPRTFSRGIAESLIQRSSPKGATHIELEMGPLKARKNFESNLPFDVPSYPYFSFTTAQSWQVLANKYSAIVDAQIEGADVKALTESVDRNASPDVLVAQLVSQLHRNVRYTGIEFGDAAIVPARPVDVMHRKYGDCKDKSALLVAMLRSFGIHANVALLESGYGPDTDSEVPGVDRFDHAIVYVDIPGKPMWIDATANQYRVGDIPSGDQGRQALIASKTTTGLTTVTEQANTWRRQTYEVRFKDFGPASITEIMEAKGPDEASLRESYISNSNVRDSLEKYVKANYLAKSLGRYELSGTDDLSSPVRVSVEAVDTPQAVTTTENAQVGLGATRVLEELPWALRAPDQAGQEARPPRSSDFLFPSQGTTENVYRLYPPALFKPGKLPKSSEVKLGPLTYSRAYRTTENGVIEVTYRLVIPQRRITAAEYEKVREAFRDYRTEGPEYLTFIPETAEFLAVGQTGKAISLLRADVAQHPNDPTTHIRFSRLLVTCGFGAPAREEAKKATELDPKSSQAWQALAWSWQNDSFGRLRRGDWDRDEAIKYQRKAVELDPDDNTAKIDLAILLEFDARGERYGNLAGTQEAIGLYREILKKQANPVLQTNLTASLFYSGQYSEAADEAAKAPEPQHSLFLTATSAIRDGAAKAIVNLQSSVVDASSRLQFLFGTAFVFLHCRHYEEGLVMMQAAARASTDPQVSNLAQLVEGMKRHEDIKFDPADPRSPVQQLVLLILTEQFTLENVRPIVAKGTRLDGLEQAAKEIRAELGPTMRLMTNSGLIWDNFVDLLLPSVLVLEKDGDDTHGYRIAPKTGEMADLYVTREDGRYKLVGDSADVGRRVLELLKQNDIASAQWWLDKVAKELKMNKNGWMPAARSLWSGVTDKTRGPEAIRIAASAMVSANGSSEEAVRTLEDALAKPKPEWDKAEIELALCEAFSHAKQWDRLLKYANQLKSSKTFSGAGLYYLAEAAAAIGDWKALEAAGLEQTKGDTANWRYVAIARMRSNNPEGAAEAIAKWKPSATDSEREELAVWNDIFRKKVTLDSLAALKKTDAGLPNVSRSNFYLIALVNSMLDRPDDALDALKKAVGDADPEKLDARAWVVYSHLCHEYGFETTAASVQKRARSAKNDSDGAKWALATLH